MEELFREILVPVPSGEAVSAEESSEQLKEESGDKVKVVGEKKAEKIDLDEMSTDSDQSVDWANEIEMQRLLDSLQQSSAAVQQQAFAAQDFSGVDLGLGLLSWNEVEGSVDVF